jgi:hypothetical protein
MRRTTSLHRNLRWWKIAEERQNLAAPQLSPQYRLLDRVDPMQLKNAL